MTGSERKQIHELRLQGEGYKSIAAVVGLSRDSIRGYCKRNGLDGDSKVVALNTLERIKMKLICPCCGNPVKNRPKGRSRRFCSEECRRKWWADNNDARTKNEKAIYQYCCHQCGKPFSAYGDNQRKYCSHDCYIKARFWREESGIQETAH